MTREEARKRLEVYLICAQCPEDKECYDSYLHSTCEYNDCREEVSLAEAIRTAIKTLDQEPKTGHWITWKEAGNEIPSETRFECSVCHDSAQTLCNGLDLLSPYCPNCGAKMESEES